MTGDAIDTSTQNPTSGRRASGPASRSAWIALGVIVALLCVALGVAYAWPNGSSPAAARYGGIPAWLPKTKIPVGRLVTASAAHPWLAIQGDSVLVELGHGHVLVTTVGPAVPEEGQFPVPKTSPCSFTVTFTAASGDVPIRASAFSILDELGRLHHPVVTLRGDRTLPARLLPGHSLSLQVTDVLPTGGGRLRWAPSGAQPIVSWDFDVEID